MRQLISGS
ncbi:hypothetical protein HID58_088018 [Brassica napus]|uniref:Uncharacterized protein n=1 Tax=Brassica napus TaxID=3708 RepID=A0ABQ7XUX9_BRANA|nr:hypothetical protein HID58_088018 [Brassica napus]